MSSPKATAHRSERPGHAGPSRHLLRLWLALLYLLALSLLILWEYHERLDLFTPECQLIDQTKSSTYGKAYSRILDWERPETADQVVTVVITADLDEIQSNLCLGRAYLADVLRVLARQSPSVVVIDKFYSPNACASEPASTQKLVEAVRSVAAPVVIGESTNGLKERTASACLARKPQLDFEAPNVRHGLTRLNTETERLPMRWLVLPDAPAESGSAPPRAEFLNSLSLAAVQAYDPAFPGRRGLQRLIERDDHPYADVDLELPRITTTQLLCTAKDAAMQQRWKLSCADQPELPGILGKVVLIGAESQNDRQTVLDRELFGYQLQARYIQSLLSDDYLRSPPIAWSLVLFVVFVFAIEGAPILMLGYVPKWKKHPLLRFAYPRRRYVWVFSWAFTLIGASSVLCLALRYLPPLAVYGDILLVMMTRLLHFSTESAEHPFLHAHHSRKASTMSHPPKHQTHDHTSPTDEKPMVDVTDPPPPPPVPVVGSSAPTPTSNNNPGNEGGTAG